MSFLNQIKYSKGKKPIRAMGYGIEGVGKTTFFAHAPSPVFISPEGGTDNLPDDLKSRVAELPSMNSWDNVRAGVQELIVGKHSFQSLVIDSADWLEQLAHTSIIGKTNKTIITVNGGYGAGYRATQNMHTDLISDLSILRDKRGMNILVTAHYQVKTVKDPEAIQDYDSFQIKCQEFVSSLWREWVDALLFMRFETHVKADEDATKARAFGTGERVMYTEHRPSYQAKNRFGLPQQMKVDWNSFYEACGRSTVTYIEVLRKEVGELFEQLKDPAVKANVEAHVKENFDNAYELAAVKKRLMELVAA
jgi:hypothetical protein